MWMSLSAGTDATIAAASSGVRTCRRNISLFAHGEEPFAVYE